MRRGAVALVVFVASLGPLAGATPWLQDGFDPARTGATPDAGPRGPDVAFELKLDQRGSKANPLMADGALFVLTVPLPNDPSPNGSAVWRIGLATAQPELFIDLGPHAYSAAMGSDGTRLFTVIEKGGVMAYDIHDGRPLWQEPYWPPTLTPQEPDEHLLCDAPAVADGIVYLTCQEWMIYRFPLGSSAPGSRQVAALYVVALDAATGAQRWLWTRGFGDATGLPADVPGTEVAPSGFVGQLVVAGDAVYVLSDEGDASPRVVGADDVLNGRIESGTERKIVWALDRATGDLRWNFDISDFAAMCCGAGQPDTAGPYYGMPYIVAAERNLYVASTRLVALDMATGAVTWSQDIDDNAPVVLTDGGPAMALVSNALVATGTRNLFAFDPETKQALWTTPLRPGLEWDWAQGLAVARGVLYGVANVIRPADAGATNTTDSLDAHILAYAIDDGKLLWESVHSFRDVSYAIEDEPRIAVADGALAIVGRGGEVVVLGKTPAAIELLPAAGNLYPSPGAEAVIDLSGSRPGVLDDRTEFRVDWGDGPPTPWQAAPVFRHAYTDPGTHLARVQARNSAGQSASEVVLFDVGGHPPAAPNDASVAPAGLGWATLLPLGALVVLVPLVAVLARRRGALASEEERALAYRGALEREVRAGRSGAETLEHLKPLRAVLDISNREHARLESEVRTRLGRGHVLVPSQQFLGRYEVVKLLGAGGGGAAYLCRDLRLGRDVVLKVLRAPGQEARLADMLREARAFATVRHERVVTLYDVEQVADEVFLVLEHVEGGSLKERLVQGPLPPGEMLRLADDLLAALGAVHGAGIVHRDVKPGNVLIAAGGHYKLGDFGIAHLPGRQTTIGDAEQAMGTAPYMSPEQARGARVDARSDLYSAALTIYEAWTGVAFLEPLEQESAAEVQRRAGMAGGSLDAYVGPSRLRAWFAKALAPRPEERFQDAATMRAALLVALRASEPEPPEAADPRLDVPR